MKFEHRIKVPLIFNVRSVRFDATEYEVKMSMKYPFLGVVSAVMRAGFWLFIYGVRLLLGCEKTHEKMP